MATAAQYAATPRTTITVLGAANANRDGSGVVNTVFTAANSGSRVDDIYVTATGVTTAGQIRLYISDGSNTRLWQEVLVTAATPSATVSPWSYAWLNQSLVLANGFSLRASTNNANVFHLVVSRAGDF
jgi:hypothetical protein